MTRSFRETEGAEDWDSVELTEDTPPTISVGAMLAKVRNKLMRLVEVMTKPGLEGRWELSKFVFKTSLSAFVMKTSKSRSNRNGTSLDIPLFGAHLAAPRPHLLDYLVDEIFVQGAYDVGPLPDRPVIVDCGANIGIATFYFVHHYAPSRLVAIEPDPATYRFLLQNVTRNGWNSVETLNMAVGQNDEELNFFFDPKQPASLMMSGIQERLPVASQYVQCRRLSTLLPQHVDLLKLDVEGMEWEVIRDLAGTGAIAAVDRMAIEYHHHLPASTDRLAEFLGILEDAGFGYQLAAGRNAGDCRHEYQDVMLYVYRK